MNEGQKRALETCSHLGSARTVEEAARRALDAVLAFDDVESASFLISGGGGARLVRSASRRGGTVAGGASPGDDAFALRGPAGFVDAGALGADPARSDRWRGGGVLVLRDGDRLLGRIEVRSGRSGGLSGATRLALGWMAQVVSLALAHLEQGSERRDTPSAGLPGADVAQAVRASEELLQSVFDGMGSGVLVLDEAGTIMLANTAALRMLQLPELGRLRGRRLDSLLEGSDFFTACTATGSQQQAVITLADGRTRSIGFTVSTVPTVGHRIVVFRDLTPLLENEKRRQRAEQLAQVGEMAAKLGHEIKNPLTSIVVGLQALRECAPLTGEDLDTLVDVMNEVQSLGAVVGDLLDSTRFSSLAPRPQDVPLIMQRLLRSQANLAASSGVDLTLVSGPIPCIAVLDTKGLSRVISNLVLNAVEACDAGDRIEMGWRMLDGAEVRRRFAGFPGDVLCIFVRDTGPGIPDEVVDQMFEPFMTTKEHGTGLGLSVVKEVVDLMGGVVDVRTGGRLDGRGTRFELMFPAGDRPTCHARTRDGARDCPQKFDCPVQYGESHYVCWTIKGQESRLETGRWEEACCECPVYRAGCLSAYWQI